MSKPRIAIPLPTSFDHEYNRVCWPQYERAIQQAGGEPIEIDLALSPSEIAKLASSCAAVLLPGSPADVNPEKYGHSINSFTHPADALRENVDELLLQDAHNLNKPILGICYGAQSLNAWRCGTLIQDLSVLPINHAAGPAVTIAHAVMVDPSSAILSPTLSTEEKQTLRILVNSSHHQAICIPGDGLLIVARSTPDDVIEAVEGSAQSTHYVLGVQWHPERMEISDASRSIFERFVGESAKWIPRTVHRVSG